MAYYTYILFNQRNGILYTGVTNDLIKRIFEHKRKMVRSFTKHYNVDKLELIEKTNPNWDDLYEEIIK